ncbi:cytochrome P450 [Granulicella aggregans]|uniref:cytochrome P450 n=1 Tax=Granulicella aggregans TaxID=474949 RepID=UPI0021DF755C|nr:cytochrome P450 [Granulicella aggregans]
MSTTPHIGKANGLYPPGPKFLPRLLTGRVFRGNAVTYMQECAQTYGDLVHYTAVGRHIYQITHPSLIEDFFLKDAAKHHRGIVMQRAKAVLGEGLLTSEEPLHMRQRRLAQPAFHRNRIASYAETIGQQAIAMTSRWQPNSTLDLREEMLAIALRIVGKCLFDLNVQSDAEVKKISEAVDAFMGFLPLAFLPFSDQIMKLPIPTMQRIRKGSAELDAIIYGMIEDRRRDPPSGLSGRGDLLSMLMDAVDPEATGNESATMSDQQLHDECLTIMLAGHETTANALSFALALLARHPEIQAAVSTEAREVLGTGDSARAPAAEDYSKLKYTTQVFAEALRLYPPVWVTARTCHEPYEIAGYKIAPGSILVAPQFVVHRDPRFFPDPLRFDPTRFSDESKSSRPRYAFYPFAGGSRQCIGEGLAWMEGVFVLAVIARDWKLTLPPNPPAEIAYNPAISLRPKHSVDLTLTRR